jgi:hypothetical protein
MTDGSSPPAIRVSDAERQQAIVVLRDAVVEGRLTLEEYSDRVGGAIAARTDHDLAELTRDLPARTSRDAPSTTVPVVAPRAILTHLVLRGPLELTEHSSYLSVFGTIDLDLRESTLPGSEVELTVRNIFGTVTILVPQGVDVRVDGGGAFASQHIDTSQPRRIPNAPIIRIHTSGPGGTIYIRSEEPSHWP